MSIDFFGGYKDFADKHGFGYDSNDVLQPSKIPQGVTNTKYCLLSKGGLIFYAYDRYSGSGVGSTTYSGFYMGLEQETHLDCSISKRFPFPDIFCKRHWVGIKEIDHTLTFRTEDITPTAKILDKQIAALYLQLWEMRHPVKLTLHSEYMAKVRPLRDSATVIGLEYPDWVVPERMDEIYGTAERILGQLKENINLKLK